MAKPKPKGSPHDRLDALEDAVDKLVADRLNGALGEADDHKGGGQ